MKIDRCTKSLLLAIAVLLSVIAFRPYIAPPPVHADSAEGHSLYIEPGVAMLRAPDGSRQVLGKVVVDLRNGNIWGFPTLTQDPYPAPGANTNAPTSHPFLLGKFAIADVDK
ncbi:MAG: hypothetical protein WCB05_15940 [Candidatus Sulfotelmatobacter sp.]